MGRKKIEVELDQGISRRDSVAAFHSWPEALAFEADRVQPHMHQDLDSLARADCDRVSGWMQLQHLAIAWRAQDVIQGIDCNPIAYHLLAEDGVRDTLQRHQCSA